MPSVFTRGVIDSPVGKLGIVVEADKVIKVEFLPFGAELILPEDGVVRQVASQLRGYFKEPKSRFDLALFFVGTPLQKKIWQELVKIPVGKTLTYSELAIKIGTSPRVVGNACRSNPLPIIVPCHRVVSSSGLGGFCGERSGNKINIKRWLLNHEGLLP